MKNQYRIIISTFSFLTLFSITSFGQWTTNTVGTGNFGINGKIKVTSTGGSVGGDNNYQGILVNHNNFDAEAIINQSFNTVPTANLFKAQAGVPFNITLEVSHKFNLDDVPNNIPTTHRVFIDYFTDNNWGAGSDWYGGSIRASIGKNEQAYLYDEDTYLTKNSQYVWHYDEPEFNGRGRKSTFTGTYTFPVGRTRGWIVIGFREKSSTVYNQNSYNNFIVLPFVVEGPTVAEVDSLGVTTKPQVPQMVIHTPPGDGSSTTITNTGRKCRKFEETYSKDEAGTLYGALKLGYKGSIGFVATIDVEAYVEFSASGTAGGFQTRTSNNETCVTVSNSLTALSAGKGAQGNDLFVGYGIDLAYGKSRNVSIQNNTVVVDTSIVYRPLPETLKEFFLTKSGIEEDLIAQQATVNDSINKTIAQRATAQYQIEVWQQVLNNNNANIATAASQTGELNEFNALSNKSYNSTIQYTSTQTIQVGHYLEGTVGIEGAAYIGGSGFKLGAKFTTKQRFGEFQSVSGGQTNDVAVTWSDDDNGDHFDFKIVKDPVYGTPIFILDSAQSKSSCPYEGGIQRDQPNLKIYTSTNSDTTLLNVSLGTAGRFHVQVCNNSAEARDYGVGFVSQSATGNLLIKSNSSSGTVNPSNGITQFGTIASVPAGGCTVGTFEISMARDPSDAAAAMSYENIEFVTYAECEPKIRSSVLASINFAGPSAPANISASPTELCSASPVTLEASCPPSTTIRWYDTPVGGFVIAQGSPTTVTPSSSTTYYVGCETANYARDRVAAQHIFLANNAPILDLTSDFSSNSLQIANTSLTANNKIINPARVKYKAGNSLTFNPGFEVSNGSTFEAEIGSCVN